MFARNQEPFLQRNLPKSIPDEPPTNIETKSGLELKICVNTYKIFFVDNTEDFFYRRRSKSINGLSHSDKLAADALIRSKKLDAFLNSAKGWKRTDNEETITERQRRFDEDYKKERFSI
jgi:paired amphipathic helix protein Sin3a